MFVFFNQNQLNMKKLLAELIGTFSLVFFGCGAAVVSGVSAAGPDGIGLLGISFAFGLTVVAMAYAIGGITGCHINPAITISMLVAGKIKTGGYNMTSAFLAEAVLTFLFLFVIFATTSKWGNSTMAGLAIGLTLVLIHLVAIPITGTSVNPARSFGPAIFAQGKALTQLWLFIAAPIAGGVLAALVWKGLFETKE